MVSEELVKTMKKGSVIVDLSVDQGGCSFLFQLMSYTNTDYLIWRAMEDNNLLTEVNTGLVIRMEWN